MIALPPSQHSWVWLKENVQLSASPLGQEEKTGMCNECSSFSGGCLRDWILSHLTQCFWRTSWLLKPGGCWEQRRGWWHVVAPKNPDNWSRHQREEEITNSWKSNWKICIVRKLHAQAQKRHTSENVWEAPRICIQVDWWKFSVQSQSRNTGSKK